MKQHKIGRNFLATYIISEKSERSLCALDKVTALEYLNEQIAEAIGSTVVGVISHKFSPIGVTAIAIISESHISLHSFPEFRMLTVDIFCCNCEVDITKTDVCIRRILEVEAGSYEIIDRR